MPALSDRADHLAGLNRAQHEAVTTTAGPLLVLAGAGTGKTRVITSRTAELVRRGTPADRILSVTFTNKAAREMRERVVAMLGGRRGDAKPDVGTFHAFCVRVLRREAPRLGYPQAFAIYDRGDQESAARSALREVKISEKALRPADLLFKISGWKTNGQTPEAVCIDDDGDLLASMAYRRYEKILSSCGAMDFDDLLIKTVKLFESDAETLARHRGRFDAIQIDEYQDTNDLQFRLVAALAGGHENLCVVGDDDQSIYSWRGAEIKHILGFSSRYPAAKTIRLEENYRCRGGILGLANELVRHNRGRHEKVLRAGRDGEAEIRFVEYDDDIEEAKHVAFDLDFLINAKGLPPGDAAILFRTNEQPRVFETELRRKKIPYTIVGTQSFFDRKEVRDLLAYLRVIANPSDRQSLLRILNTPPRGVGRTTAEKIVKETSAGGDFWDSVDWLVEKKEIGGKALAGLSGLRDLLSKYRDRMRADPLRLAESCRALIEEIDYEGEIARLYDQPEQQAARLSGVTQLTEALKEYCVDAKRPRLEKFLQDTTLDGDDRFSKDDRFESNAVRLMTLHAAKGLEFPRVYLVGLEEGILPHRKSVETGGAAIEEERRLAYVGITRAKDALIVSRAVARRKWGKLRPSDISRFVFEMRGDGSAEPFESVTAGAEA